MYCKYCGQRKDFIDSGLFDEKTGHKEVILKCMNVLCQKEGCRNNNGHVLEKLSIWDKLTGKDPKCLRCGAQLISFSNFC